jgi:TyrR family helix-turn-helix protein
MTKYISRQKLRKMYYKENVSARQIAERLGCSHTTVINYLNKYDFRVKRRSEIMTGRKLSEEHRDKVVKSLKNYTSV